MFQSTHPHGVRRHLSISCCISEEFQSTHPHGVRLGSMLIFPKCGNVSIHAPTRGATVGNRYLFPFCRAKFQSTHPHGVRQCPRMVYRWYRVVSIHAPTRGATTAFLCAFKCFMFQSTHPHGVRRCQLLRNNGIVGFQSTHPHGVRLACLLACLLAFQSTHPHGVRRLVINSLNKLFICFNPRTHTGCDFCLKT